MTDGATPPGTGPPDPHADHGGHAQVAGAETQQQHRTEKLAARRARGEREPYRWDVDAWADGVHAAHEDLAPGAETDEVHSMAGRLALVRRQGGLTFAVLADRTGELQLFVDTKTIGADAHHDFDQLDRGDWVGVTGTVMRTRRGEISLRVKEFALLGKALRPPPDKDKPFTDVELRSRQRYVDLMSNASTRRVFDIRHKAIRAIRDHMGSLGYTEVEGPMLQSIQGGAAARPFITHHNALDIDLYLRIALELHLKRLIVGGMDRVFEIGRVFRNEGVDTRHNPEFTLLEAYQAFADYHDLTDLVEGIIKAAAHAALGDDITVTVQGEPMDLAPAWERRTFTSMIEEHTGAVMHPDMPLDEARRLLDERGVEYDAAMSSGLLMKQLYDERVQHSVRGPVFCTDYPAADSPLARRSREDPAYAERFELIIAGSELCNAYSEQNDPVVQLAAFEDEARAKAAGDPEAGDVDYDYVRALEYGMPCTGGIGIGIDRLVMLLASVDSIREVILFPTLRPEFGTGPQAPGGPGSGSAGADGAGAARAGVAGGTAPAGVTAGATTGVTALAPAGSGVATSADPAAATRLTASLAQERRRARLVGRLSLLGGIALVLTLVPGLHGTLLRFSDQIGPTWFRVTFHVVTLLAGIVQIVLSDQLAKQKHRAWQVSTVVFGVGFLANVLKGPHPVVALYCLVMVALLVANRRVFRAVGDPPSLLRLVRILPLYLVAVLAFGLSSLYFERDQLSPELTFGGAVATTLQGLVGVPGPYTYDSAFFARYFPAALVLLGVVGLLGLLVLLFRPLQSRSRRTSPDREHAQRLVATYGWDTLSSFALRDDKSYFFSSDGEAMVAYTYLGGYGLVSGDPIGAPASVPLVVDEFREHCRLRAWVPAFLAVRESDVPLYHARGFKSFYLGDEAIIRCGAFTLQGSARKSLRGAVRRVARTHEFRLVDEAQASPELVGQLNAISEKWRGKAPERGFTMSLSQDVEGDGHNRGFLLCVAVDADGVPGGFLRLVPVAGPQPGYTLDLMRHDPDAPNGMTEFLIARSAEELRDRGVDRLSMNFAMWGKLFEPAEHASWRERVARRVVGALNPFFQIQSLHDFNAKFDPEWLSRVLVYRDEVDLPRVGLLYAGAEGFLAVPVLGELLVPQPVEGDSEARAPAASSAA